MLRSLIAFSLPLLLACGDDGTMIDPDAGTMCVTNTDCSDGVFCNGSERCAPAESGADGRGCMRGEDPCFEGQDCSEAEARCVTVDCSMADLDGDGVESIDCGGTDCDDGDGDRFPGNPEVCDAEGHDEDCDLTTLGADEDGDGYAPLSCCNGATCGRDCDDSLAGVSPDAVEACNGVDEDCDGDLDEGAREIFYRDLDGDGFGDPASSVERACVDDPLFSRQSDDCDDRDAATFPGADEICDGRDNDCSTGTDYDVDVDGDGHLVATAACTGGDLPKDDCDDANPFAHGGAPERCSGIDDDCDGTIDETAADDWCTAQARAGGDADAVALCGAGASCILSACAGGAADCDGVLGNGCEVDLTMDPDNCGGCGTSCASGVCNGGVCQSETGPDRPSMVRLVGDDRGVCGLTADGQAICWGDLLAFERHARPAVFRDGSTPLTGIVDLALGAECMCALMGDGRVRCAGSVDLTDPGLCNATGVSTQFVVTPTAIRFGGAEITDATLLTTMAHTGCIVRPNVTVGGVSYEDVAHCWGSSNLGDGTDVGSDDLRVVIREDGTPLDGVTDLDGGEQAACAVSGGRVFCWGGPGTVADSNRAVAIERTGAVPLTAEVVEVSGAHACALDGTDLRCWGDNANRAVSPTDTTTTITQAVQIPGSWTEVATSERDDAGQLHTCARDTTGVVECWGRGPSSNAEWGTGCTEVPCTIQSAEALDRIQGPITSIHAGEDFSCGLVDGWPWCWGRGERGVLGVSGEVFDSVPPVPIPDMAPPVQVSFGFDGGCGRTASGTVACWGDATLRGEVGPDQSEVVYRLADLDPALDVAVAGTKACVIGTDRQVRCFGGRDRFVDAEIGFLGGATLRTPADPYLVPSLTDVRELEVTNLHACAIRTDGTVWCWGESDAGATGEIGPSPCGDHVCSLAPHQVTGLPGVPVELALGGVYIVDEPGFSCARLADGRVACWGSNSLGALGNGTLTASTTPVLVSGLDDAVELSSNGLHVCARRSNGEAVCWGADIGGTLGTLDRLPGCGFAPCSNEPVRATALRGIETIAAGLNRTCATTETGAVYCWGGESFTDGLIDVGPNPSSPVPALAFPQSLAVGNDVHCAVTRNAVRCWGMDGGRIPNGFGSVRVDEPDPLVGL